MATNMADEDLAHMRAALALGARGLGETWPNPAVGCVIVRAGRVVGRGRTASGGRPHAETEALAMAGGAARGATAYVTLEPCSHHGHTPPCADALISAGIGRVVVAVADPDARVSGQGLARLREAGVLVETGLLADAAKAAHAGFFSRIERSRPLLTLKLASTLDGRIATRTGQSQWITGVAARRAAHRLRATHDAILVGAGTVLADNPRLTCRLTGARQRPLLRVIADSHLRTKLTSALVATAGQEPLWLLAREDVDADRARAFTAAGARVIGCRPGPLGIDLADALRRLADAGITRVLAEGGGQLAASLLRDDLVDRLAWFHAPSVMGGDGYAAVRGFGIAALSDMPGFVPEACQDLGADRLMVLRRREGRELV